MTPRIGGCYVEQLVDYTDADWAKNTCDRRSTFEFVFSLGSVAIQYGGGSRSTRVTMLRELTRAKGANKPTKKVEVCGTGRVVERGTELNEEREQGERTLGGVGGKDQQTRTS